MILKINSDRRLKLDYTALDNALGKPEVFTIGDINDETVTKVQEYISDCHTVGQEVIPIIINSNGGYLDSVFAIIDMFDKSEVPIATIVEGTAKSGGAILTAFGTAGYRYMAPHANMMMHEAAAGCWGKATDLKSHNDETLRRNNLVYEYMSKRCGKEKSYFMDKFHEMNNADWYFDADEAKKHNIIDKIGLPSFVIDIGIKFSLVD